MEEPINSVKSAVDELVGVNSRVKRKRKTESNKKMELFYNVILTLEEINARSMIAHYDLGIDTTKYDEKFHEAIDAMLYVAYGKECYELISFYIYDRINMEDQSINPIIDQTGEEVYLNTPYDLYVLMKRVNPKID